MYQSLSNFTIPYPAGVRVRSGNFPHVCVFGTHKVLKHVERTYLTAECSTMITVCDIVGFAKFEQQTVYAIK